MMSLKAEPSGTLTAVGPSWDSRTQIEILIATLSLKTMAAWVKFVALHACWSFITGPARVRYDEKFSKSCKRQKDVLKARSWNDL
jgi:hypothetical protein